MRAPLHLIAAAACIAAPLVVQPLPAQGLGWHASTEANASLFFGNTEQRVVATHANIAHADSAFELQSDLRFSYGEASTTEGDRSVNKRSWLASLSFDNHPFARYSPFFFGTIESSFEKRISLRYSGGVGGKVTFVQNDASETSFSIALLAERTMPADGVGDAGADRTLARWSARFRTKHKIDDRLSVNGDALYQPNVSAISEFTFSSTTTLAYQMSQDVSLTLSFLDNYDSGAILRGATNNNDGQFLFGVLTTF